jgi:hypothetical protein
MNGPRLATCGRVLVVCGVRLCHQSSPAPPVQDPFGKLLAKAKGSLILGTAAILDAAEGL